MVDFFNTLLGKGRFQREVAPGDLRLLDKIRNVGEQYLTATPNQRAADRSFQMALAVAGQLEQGQVGLVPSQAPPEAMAMT